MKRAWVSIVGLGVAALLASSCTNGSSAGACAFGQMACNGSCINFKSDSQNCGVCGYACASGTTCQAGTCACSPGLVVCGGACVSSNTDHCGGGCTPCPGGNVCNNGQCSASCPSGSTACSDGACSSSSDSAHCGASCTSCSGGATCINGSCGCAVAGQENCGGVCVDTGSSVANCGGCGQACAPGQTCTAGVCAGQASDASVGGAGGGAGGAGGAAGGNVLITSAPNAYWNTNGQLTVVASGNADVTVNDASLAQTWEGFGGAFNEMGWRYLSMLSQADRDNAIQLLFGANGAHFNIGRIPIGASDYAINRYTEDETSSDTALASFAITEDMQYLIPFVNAALAVNPDIRLWASPWTPPTWMKQGPFLAGNMVSPFDGGTMKTDDATMKAFAQYLIRFVQAYGQQRITIETIAPQNEPNYGQNYPSCLWAASTFSTFVGRYLGPAITTAGLSTKIMLGTMSNPNSGADPAVVSSVMNDATARSYIKVIGMQWGMQINVNGAKQYNLPIWQTEHKAGNYPFSVTGENPAPGAFNASRAPNDQTYGAESWGLIRDWIKTGVTAYSAWNMVLDTVGLGIDTTRIWPQNALLTVDTTTRRLNITPAFYVFRHLSQFVVPGARVVATSGGDAVAFKNPDGSVVTVLYNSGAARTMTVSVLGKRVQFGMPATGWATVKVQ